MMLMFRDFMASIALRDLQKKDAARKVERRDSAKKEDEEEGHPVKVISGLQSSPHQSSQALVHPGFTPD